MSHEYARNSVRSKQDLVDFIDNLVSRMDSGGEKIDNYRTRDFIDALASWIESSDSLYRNFGIDPSEVKCWELVADGVAAALIYD